MPTNPGRLAKAIAATLRSAQARLAELGAAPGAKRPLLDRPVGDATLRGSGGVTPKEFVGLLRDGDTKAASILQGMFDGDVLAFSISMAHAKAQVILQRVADHESPKVRAALEALEVALKAAQLWDMDDWRELSGVLLDLAAADQELTDILLDQGPQVPLASLQQVIAETQPVLEVHLRVLRGQQRASEESARRRLAVQQQRICAFVRAIRSDPQGGPKRWAALVSPGEFGPEERNVRSAERWFYRHRPEIHAALAANADSPTDCQFVPPDP